VRFVRAGDRYGHVVETSDGDVLQPVLQSLEGKSDEAWPPSPPLQDLHVESRAGGEQVALLVGGAGRSHWSLSVTLDPTAGAVLFDAACRTSEAPRWLGSSYRLLEPAAEASLTNCGLGLGVEILDGLDQPALNRQQATIALPARLTVEAGSHTIRWRYRIVQRTTPAS
jgi:hypothetical protein